MNKKLLVSLFICISIQLLVYAISVDDAASIRWSDLGLALFVAGFIYFLPGLIISAIKDSGAIRQIGKGILLASALLLLTGLSICSIDPVLFH